MGIRQNSLQKKNAVLVKEEEKRLKTDVQRSDCTISSINYVPYEVKTRSIRSMRAGMRGGLNWQHSSSKQCSAKNGINEPQ